jgi:hypothetical protein
VIALSHTTKLRLNDAAQRAGQTLAPALADAVGQAPLSLASMRAAIAADAVRDFADVTRALDGAGAVTLAEGAWGLDAQLLVGGYAELPDGNGAHLHLTEGAFLAVEDLLLRATAKPDFFLFNALYDPKDEQRLRAPIHVLEITVEGPERFFDYSWLRRLEPDGMRHALLSSMPLTPWRLCQFELLRTLSVQWLCLHEAAHWLGGHLHLLAQSAPAAKPGLQFCDPDLALGAAGAPDRVEAAITAVLSERGLARRLPPRDARKCFEYQADYLGFLLLSMLLKRSESAFTRYEAAMRQLALPDYFEEVIALDKPARVRAQLLAAGAVILLIERGTLSLGAQSVYPLPLARLLNLQMAAIAGSPFAQRRDDGVFLKAHFADRPDFQAFIGGALARSLLDFNVLAKILALDPFIDNRPGKPVRFQSLAEDLLAFFDPTMHRGRLKTKAAREFHALHDGNQMVRQLCAPFSKIDPEML